MALYATDAINLSSRRFGEADKLMVFFTKSKGKISAIAKSALKPGSKFGGRLEVFAYNELLLAEGKNLDILSQAETIENFSSLIKDEKRLKAGFYMVKLMNSYLESNVKNEGLFNLLKECLYLLKDSLFPENVIRIFDIKLADTEGFLPLYNFSGNIQSIISDIKKGGAIKEISSFERGEIDSVLVPCLCDHVGKDIRLWKSM